MLSSAATERMIQLASTAVDTLERAGAAREVIQLVIDAIAALDAQQYADREDTISRTWPGSGRHGAS
jgi:hypothetical protein